MIRILQVVMMASVIYGAVREADVVWQIGDIGVGLMAWGTLISIILLFPKAIRALKDYEKNHRNLLHADADLRSLLYGSIGRKYRAQICNAS